MHCCCSCMYVMYTIQLTNLHPSIKLSMKSNNIIHRSIIFDNFTLWPFCRYPIVFKTRTKNLISFFHVYLTDGMPSLWIAILEYIKTHITIQFERNWAGVLMSYHTPYVLIPSLLYARTLLHVVSCAPVRRNSFAHAVPYSRTCFAFLATFAPHCSWHCIRYKPPQHISSWEHGFRCIWHLSVDFVFFRHFFHFLILFRVRGQKYTDVH